MFVGGCGIQDDAGGRKFVLERKKFAVHEHVFDAEDSGGVYGLDVAAGLNELLEFAIGDIFGSRVFDMIADGCKKKNPVHKEQVTR
jgi:hypothetical protein